MKKKLFVVFITLVFISACYITIFSASVQPQRMPGNDSNPQQYTPPAGCIHYEIPGSANPGTYTVNFDEDGNVDPNGSLEFTVTVGQISGDDFTKVLSWSSNFPIYAVIVKGGDDFNLYKYPNTARSDTDLVSPTNASGKPANISHVSVIICPKDFPKESPSPTPAETTPPETTAITAPPTSTPSSTVVPPTTGPTPPPTGDNNLLEVAVLFVASGTFLAFFSFYILRKNKVKS